jgi:CBS domain-containing protein
LGREPSTIRAAGSAPSSILNEGLVRKVAIRDKDIFTDVVDYGVPRRDRPTLRDVSYEELKSGRVTIKDSEVKVSPLSSLKKANDIAETLKAWIQDATFYLTAPAETLSTDTVFKPMRQTRETAFIKDLVHEAITCREDEDIGEVAQRLIDQSVNHVVVIDGLGNLKGIVTSWDITKSVAEASKELRDVIVKRVYTATADEPLESASRRMAQHNISALPVVDGNGKVLGIITSEDISKLLGGGGLG